MMKRPHKHLTQCEVVDMLRTEGLSAGISSQGTISAFVPEPMFSVVAFRLTDNQWGGFYSRAEVARWISDYRMTKAGNPQYDNR